ncbi:MAG: HPP family protein [Rhodobacteraceae bacterium]|nr:HPP family protein [Paracoccaceae bacterium]
MVSHREKLISGFGGALAIFVVFATTAALQLGLEGQALLIASMGASAVLLFAAPHSPLAQPRNVIVGHLVSALIGVVVARVLPDTALGGALAAGLAITAMYYLNVLHPPGGATALIPVIGGPAVASYGLAFVLFPVGFGAVLMVALAVAFNAPFAWRRYPQRPAKTPLPPPYPDITHADFVAALSEIDTYVDISEADLLRIYAIAVPRKDSSDRAA